MVNTNEFAERLKKIMKYYELTATALAESIQVQRSNISHLLSARNKPSLEFVLKILDAYPEVEFYWLIKGHGNFPKKEITNEVSTSPTLFDSKDYFNGLETIDNDDVEKIIIFYKNGTFKTYKG